MKSCVFDRLKCAFSNFPNLSHPRYLKDQGYGKVEFEFGISDGRDSNPGKDESDATSFIIAHPVLLNVLTDIFFGQEKTRGMGEVLGTQPKKHVVSHECHTCGFATCMITSQLCFSPYTLLHSDLRPYENMTT